MTAQELHFFNNVAADWDRRDCLTTPEKIDRIMDLGGVKPGDAILDLGTGTGVLLPFLASRIGQEGSITAVDLSTEMLRLATEKFRGLTPKPRFLQLDFEKQAVPGRYNHITMYCVLPHLETPLHTLAMLCRQNLLPGGNILIAFPCDARRINSIHRHKTVDAHALLPAREMTDYLCAHAFDARLLADTPDLYLIAIRGLKSM